MGLVLRSPQGPGPGAAITKKPEALKLPLHLQSAGYAFAYAHIALHGEVKGKAAVGRGLEGDAQLAHAGAAFKVRLVMASP